MELLFVGIGGALGALARFRLGKAIAQKSRSIYPVNTFIINISGAVLLGILTALNAGENIYALFGDGFLGAYTTFSTFMYEGFSMFNDNEKKNAAVYIIATLILGIIGYITGYGLCRLCFYS
jgi:CrcB protein